MSSIPIVAYVQGVSGHRWHLYAPWSKLMPIWLMDKLAARLPVRQIWQGFIDCGNQEIKTVIYAGPQIADGWLPKFELSIDAHVIISANLSRSARNTAVPPGHLLVASSFRLAFESLVQARGLDIDNIAIGLAVKNSVTACWLANVDDLARRVTILTDKRSRLWPQAASGLAPRQLNLDVRHLDVDFMIVSPELEYCLENISFKAGTILLRTDGQLVTGGSGLNSLLLDCLPPLLPPELIAEATDTLAILEAILLTAYLSKPKHIWPVNWLARLSVVRKAVSHSGWAFEWLFIDNQNNI